MAATCLTHIAPQIITITKAAAAANELFGIIDMKSAIDSLSTSGLTPEKGVGEVKLNSLILPTLRGRICKFLMALI